ncbi:MAG: hypothetical protein JO347_02080 [Candidatus Eremiobacteraeota bacterium]|nr:hypothetical protein [Candidatus Eremiobacteraeota bacterium]
MKPPEAAPLPRLKIRRLDAPYRWLVQSESDPEIWYGVDLLENNRIGSCDCDHFRYRLSELASQAKLPLNTLRCKHLLVVREALLNALLFSMAESRYNDETKHDRL